MRLFLIASVAVLWAIPSFALEPSAPATAPLAMADAVTLALKQNRELAAVREELAGLKTAAELSGSLPNPVLELEGTTGALTNSPDEKGFGISLAQEIPLMPVGTRRTAVAQAEAKVALARLGEQERELADQVRRAWLEAALSQKRLILLQEQQEIAAKLLEMATIRFKAGDIPEFELQLADLDQRKSSLRHAEAVAAAASINRRLALLLGLDGTTTLPQLADLPEVQPIAGTDESLISQAMEQRPGLIALQHEMSREDAALSLARAEAVPSLTVALSYSNERSAQNAYELQGATLTAGKERTNDHILGLKLSLPLPLFSRNQPERAKAAARLSAARQRLEAGRRTAEYELRELLAQHRLARRALELHRTALGPVARDNFRIQQDAFELGEIVMQLLLDEKRRLGEQQEAELTALQTAIETHSRLAYALNPVLKDTTAQGGKE